MGYKDFGINTIELDNPQIVTLVTKKKRFH